MQLSRAENAVYDNAYGFREAPFSLTPDPKFVYSSPSHEQALQTIVHALSRREGLIVVTGDIGCGKTTLCRRLIPLLPPRTFLSLVLNPFLAADDLLRQVLEDFGLVSSADARAGAMSRATSHTLARTLQEFLNSLARMNGTAVIIVDEAQNLPLRTLEQIRLLSNFETDTTKLLQIILVGQKNLNPVLELEELRQLNQRISRRCHVDPLSPSEVGAYVTCRLEAAMPQGETPRVQFTTGAVMAIAQLTGGVPRIINLVCDRALELESARAHDGRSIDRRRVLAAARNLGLPVPSALRFSPVALRPALAAAAAVVVLAAGAFIATRTAWPVLASALRSTPRAASGTSGAARSTPPPTPAAETHVAAPTAPADARLAMQPATLPVPIVERAASYQLVVASFETLSRASAVAADLVGRGHPARVATSGGWNVVVVGPYSSEPEAASAKDALSKSGFTDIRLARMP